jgi:hypothetical protein
MAWWVWLIILCVGGLGFIIGAAFIVLWALSGWGKK